VRGRDSAAARSIRPYASHSSLLSPLRDVDARSGGRLKRLPPPERGRVGVGVAGRPRKAAIASPCMTSARQPSLSAQVSVQAVRPQTPTYPPPCRGRKSSRRASRALQRQSSRRVALVKFVARIKWNEISLAAAPGFRRRSSGLLANPLPRSGGGSPRAARWGGGLRRH
jgi:hypothetical protein